MKRLYAATAVFAVAGLVVGYGQVRAAEPTQADFDACNREAQSLSPSASVGSGTPSSPSTGDSTGAGSNGSSSSSTGTGSGSTETPSTGYSMGTGASVSRSAMDPSLRGMDAPGLTDPAYQQAYRDCLTRRGF